MKVEEEEETSNTSNESFVDPISENHGHEIRKHGREPVRQYDREPVHRIMVSKVLTDLSKHYHDTDLKFSGDLYDSLDTKLKIFYDLCRIAGVSPDLYHDAYPTMLKGRAR